MNTNTKRAFTLIEMLVVVAIIGILTTLIMTSVSRVRKSSVDTKRRSNIENIRGAMITYYSSKGTWPDTTNWTTLVTTLSSSGFISDNISEDEDGDTIPDYNVCDCGTSCSSNCNSPSSQNRLCTKCVITDGEGCVDEWYCLEVK